jgi:hypothetical protein
MFSKLRHFISRQKPEQREREDLKLHGHNGVYGHERIWVGYFSREGKLIVPEELMHEEMGRFKELPTDTEYVRIDLYDKLQDELDMAKLQVRRFALAIEEHEKICLGTG